MEVKVLRKEHIEKAGLPTDKFGTAVQFPIGKYGVKDGYALSNVVKMPVTFFTSSDLYNATTTDGHPIVIPAELYNLLETVIIKTSMDELVEILEERYGNDAWVDKSEQRPKFYIHFRELKITNTFELEHTIKDLVVECKLEMDSTNRDITKIRSILGRRFTVNSQELAIDYFHSHLDQRYNNTLSSFCLGTSPLASFSYFTANALTLEAFLIQLEAYLKWESLEGKPHRFISNIKSNNDSVSTNSTVPDVYVHPDSLFMYAKSVLTSLTWPGVHSSIKTIRTTEGLVYYLHLDVHIVRLITDIVSSYSGGHLTPFDMISKMFVTADSLHEKKRVFEGGSALRNLKTQEVMYPKVVDEGKIEQNIVKVLNPSVLTQVVRMINAILTEVAIYE